MRVVRRGALVGGTVVLAVIAATVAIDCASPTQIVIDVRADISLCQDSAHPLQVGFGTTKAADVNNLNAPLEDFQTGCHDPESGIVGTMVIKPNGDKNETIGIRVVAAVGGDANACANDQSDCIISTRLVTFQPGTTVQETVALSGQCKGEVCGENQDCVNGQCVDRTAILNDGGYTPDTGHVTPPQEASTPPVDSGIADVFIPNDACAHCTWGVPDAATCDRNTCSFPCTLDSCGGHSVCGFGLDCKVTCQGDQACDKTACSTTGNCDFACGDAGNDCFGIFCDAGSCNVDCPASTNGLTCNGITLNTPSAKISCDTVATSTSPSCDNVDCYGPQCARTCGTDAGGCGLLSICDGGGCVKSFQEPYVAPADAAPPAAN